MEDLGELGFWLAVGIVVAALILAGGQKEREKERQKQETLRALLTADGKSTSEVLQYMRERDAADAAREHAIWVASQVNFRKLLAVVAAFLIGMISFVGGILLFSRATSCPASSEVCGRADSWPIAVGLLLGAWAAGSLIAFLVYILIRGKKNVPPPGA